jgi:hypothetical protein
VLCLPPCWWHHVEAAPGLNLMINAFVWALPPRKEYAFEIMMRQSIRTALALSKRELSRVRTRLYRLVASEADSNLSTAAKELERGLARFLQLSVPGYWRKIARCYYDHYIFQMNGHPVSASPERHATGSERKVLYYSAGGSGTDSTAVCCR